MIYSLEAFNAAKRCEVFEFTCKHCGKVFTKTKGDILKNSGKLPVFCCHECATKHRSEEKTITVKCAFCGKEKVIELNKYLKSETKRFFCNKSCAAKYNNHITPKREKTDKTLENEVCPLCGKKKSLTAKLCKNCESLRRTREKRERTLGDWVGYDGDSKYLTHKCQGIRKDARAFMENESKQEKVCAYCHNHEFDGILEVHHLKNILSFDRNAKIKEINNDENLVWLCPNHHAMIERGLITLE